MKKKINRRSVWRTVAKIQTEASTEAPPTTTISQPAVIWESTEAARSHCLHSSRHVGISFSRFRNCSEHFAVALLVQPSSAVRILSWTLGWTYPDPWQAHGRQWPQHPWAWSGHQSGRATQTWEPRDVGPCIPQRAREGSEAAENGLSSLVYGPPCWMWKGPWMGSEYRPQLLLSSLRGGERKTRTFLVHSSWATQNANRESLCTSPY